MQTLADSWFLVIAAYFFGLLTGWILSKRITAGVKNGDANANHGEIASDGPASAKIGALEAEIKTARKLLEARDEDDAAAAETLTGLDEAIKRANGRLKLIMKAVKRAKDAD